MTAMPIFAPERILTLRAAESWPFEDGSFRVVFYEIKVPAGTSRAWPSDLSTLPASKVGHYATERGQNQAVALWMNHRTR